MMQPGTLGNLIPPGEDWVGRTIRDLSRDIEALRSARTLESATIGAGGIRINGGSITLPHTSPEPGVDMSIAQGTGSIPGVTQSGGAVDWTPHDNPTASPATVIGVLSGYYTDLAGVAVQSSTEPTKQMYGQVAVDVTHSRLGVWQSTPRAFAYTNCAIGKDDNRAEVQINLGDPYGTQDFRFSCRADQADFGSVGADVGLKFTSGELWVVQQSNGTTFKPIRASSFPTASSREVKDVIADAPPFDSLAAVKAAPVSHWRYRPEFADDGGRTHVGPMAEDLPVELTDDTTDTLSVDLLSLVGTLWDAVGKLTARVEALEQAAAS